MKMKKLFCLMMMSLTLVLMASGLSWADLVQWTTGTGANNHWYEAVYVENGISWTDANSAAQGKGGYLATSTSAEENTFAYNLVTDKKFWIVDAASNSEGPWLGGYQTGPNEPYEGWQWVTGETWSYGYPGTGTYQPPWESGEPNNAGDEDYLQFFNIGKNTDGTPIPASTWNDRINDPPSPYKVKGYIVEYNINPVPLPGALLLFGSGLVGLIGLRRKFKS